MANMSLAKNPMPEQDPVARAGNFDEVALGYTPEMAIDEAKRCLNCKNMPLPQRLPRIGAYSRSSSPRSPPATSTRRMI